MKYWDMIIVKHILCMELQEMLLLHGHVKYVDIQILILIQMHQHFVMYVLQSLVDVSSNKYLIIKYNINEEKEIWSYDSNVIDKAYEWNYNKY